MGDWSLESADCIRITRRQLSYIYSIIMALGVTKRAPKQTWRYKILRDYCTYEPNNYTRKGGGEGEPDFQESEWKSLSNCYLGPESLTAERCASLLQSDGPDEVPSSLIDLKKPE